jgi:hypothetical protein
MMSPRLGRAAEDRIGGLRDDTELVGRDPERADEVRLRMLAVKTATAALFEGAAVGLAA